MSEDVISLWPENFDVPEVEKLPVDLLEEQAALLGDKTDHHVTGRVLSTGEGEYLTHKFYLYSTRLNYSYLLFYISHKAIYYPVDFYNVGAIGVENHITCDDEPSLISAMKRVIQNPETIKVVSALIQQSKNA
jgi:hypothetical protein